MARMPFLTREDLPPDKQELYDQVAITYRGHVPRHFSVLLNSPEAASSVAMLGERIRYGSPTIPAAVKEIIILTTARVFECEYVWTHHCDSAKKAGVREEVVEAIRKGGPPRRLLPKEGVFLQFTRELLERKRVRDATYSGVEHLLGKQGTIDLIMAIGYFTMICLAINALEIDLE